MGFTDFLKVSLLIRPVIRNQLTYDDLKGSLSFAPIIFNWKKYQHNCHMKATCQLIWCSFIRLINWVHLGEEEKTCRNKMCSIEPTYWCQLQVSNINYKSLCSLKATYKAKHNQEYDKYFTNCNLSSTP